jgi:hypothetical protein
MGERTLLQRLWFWFQKVSGLYLVLGTAAAARCRWRRDCAQHHGPCWFCPLPASAFDPPDEAADGRELSSVAAGIAMAHHDFVQDLDAVDYPERRRPFLRLTPPPDLEPGIVADELDKARARAGGELSWESRPCWVTQNEPGYVVSVVAEGSGSWTDVVPCEPAGSFRERLQVTMDRCERDLRAMLERLAAGSLETRTDRAPWWPR